MCPQPLVKTVIIRIGAKLLHCQANIGLEYEARSFLSLFLATLELQNDDYAINPSRLTIFSVSHSRLLSNIKLFSFSLSKFQKQVQDRHVSTSN